MRESKEVNDETYLSRGPYVLTQGIAKLRTLPKPNWSETRPR
jgi:hypothetical protein